MRGKWARHIVNVERWRFLEEKKGFIVTGGFTWFNLMKIWVIHMITDGGNFMEIWAITMVQAEIV